MTMLHAFHVIHVIFLKMFSHGSIVGGLIMVWVLQEATVL